MNMAAHDCSGSDYIVCMDGDLYGPCEHEDCNGDCTNTGQCHCDCHNEPSAD
jgi:hypothetical protein